MSRVGRHARRNMAVKNADASQLVAPWIRPVLSIPHTPSTDDFIKDFEKRMTEKFSVPKHMLVPPVKLDPLVPPPSRMDMWRALGLFDNPPIMDPHQVVTIDSGIGRRVGIPAFMLPRDNKVEGTPEQELSERQRYDLLCKNNEYVVPQADRDRYGSPNWPEDLELVDGRHPDAGDWGKLCYRTACQQPNAFYYNIGSRKHYCRDCAKLINKENMGGTKLLFLAETEGQHTEKY